MSAWRRLDMELARLDKSGAPAMFWLRDDDAIGPSPALDRLLALSNHFGLPVALAVIPASANEALAGRLDHTTPVTVIAHGWSHINHAAPGEKKQELGPHRPKAVVLADLSAGLSRLATLFGDRFVPILAPPWNRIDPDLLPDLRKLGFSAISGFGNRPGAASVPVINANLDIVDWRGGRICRPEETLVEELLSLLARRGTSIQPIGVMTHHLVHDAQAWNFLRRLFDRTAGRWQDVRRLIEPRANANPTD